MNLFFGFQKIRNEFSVWNISPPQDPMIFPLGTPSAW